MIDRFLEAICATPQDDTPRLVYADWLDEHGDPARAEFIRVQVELARHGHRRRKQWESAVIKHGPDYYEAASFGSTYIEVGDRVDITRVKDRKDTVGAKRTVFIAHHGLLVTRILHEDDNQRRIILKRDERSVPVPPELVEREQALLCKPANFVPWLPKCLTGGAFLGGRYIDDSASISFASITLEMATFERGFVAGLLCTWQAWKDYAAALRAQAPIESVAFTTPCHTFGVASDRLHIFLQGFEGGSRPMAAQLINGATARELVVDMLEERWNGIRFTPMMTTSANPPILEESR